MKKLGVIYSLSDENGLKYIGQTFNFRKRSGQHCSLAQNRGNTKVKKWLYSLLCNGKLPVINILEISQDLDKRECYWISFYKQKGFELLNMTDGGKDMMILLREKRKKPWGNHLSPLQYRLKTLSEMIRTFRCLGQNHLVDKWKARMIFLNEIIKRVGHEKMNNALYIKYGK